MQYQKRTIIWFYGNPFNITVTQVCAPTTDARKLKLIHSWRPITSSRTNIRKYIIFIIRDWNGKVESQDIPRIKGKFGYGVQNEAGQSLTEFCQENALVIENNTRDNSTHGHHQMVNTEIRLTMFFAAEDGGALYSQQNKNGRWVAQIMNSLLPNSDLN